MFLSKSFGDIPVCEKAILSANNVSIKNVLPTLLLPYKATNSGFLNCINLLIR